MSNIPLLNPAEGWVLVQAEEVSAVTAGGIIKPDSVIEAEQKRGGDFPPSYLVISIPETSVGTYDADTIFEYPEEGAKVLVNTRGGQVLKCGDFFLVQLSCIVAVVQE